MIDLGSWVDEDFRIKGDEVPPEHEQKTE